jgi:hypothetical protein
MSARETVLAALHARLATITGISGAASVQVTRNEALALRLDDVAAVAINLVDGNGTISNRLMGGGAEVDHSADVEVAVRHEVQATRDALFDAALAAIDGALAADEKLGGACDSCEALYPVDVETEPFGEGGALLKTGVVPVAILFTAPRAIG